MFFHGEYKHQLDDKFRLRLPAKYRGDLGKFVVMKAVNGCLYVISIERFEERIRSKTKKIPLLNAKLQAPKDLIYSSIEIPEEDAQGRFVLPSNLREFAAIGKNIVIVGADEHLVIWGAERYEKKRAGQLELSEENISFNQEMEKLEGFEI